MDIIITIEGKISLFFLRILVGVAQLCRGLVSALSLGIIYIDIELPFLKYLIRKRQMIYGNCKHNEKLVYHKTLTTNKRRN
jgi:hypothetical protein